MRIVFDVAPERAEFVLELLRNLSFVKNPRPQKTAEVASFPDDSTDYLLNSAANADRLRLAYEQFDRGERVDFNPPAE